ncbi:MAG: helix-turn-helix domain-containing protein [Candidatus Gastranaerophilales bacterium]|nr:helix-turn-helix domain-containing protein [Candidatus Gastranaerophilales bacterium]
MEFLKNRFGMRVKELRKSKNLTQEQLAEKIGMDTQNLCKMENGNHFPQFKNLCKIAEALDVEIKDLFDFAHFTEREKIINEITNFLKNAENKDVEFMYKSMKNIQEYNI